MTGIAVFIQLYDRYVRHFVDYRHDIAIMTATAAMKVLCDRQLGHIGANHAKENPRLLTFKQGRRKADGPADKAGSKISTND